MDFTSYQIVLSQFIQTCRDRQIAQIAWELLLAKYSATGVRVRLPAGLDPRVTA